jgi:hypothetical protein
LVLVEVEVGVQVFPGKPQGVRVGTGVGVGAGAVGLPHPENSIKETTNPANSRAKITDLFPMAFSFF